eukprot:1171964-Rhodomonas_salina.3
MGGSGSLLAVVLRLGYAMSGTDVGCAAARNQGPRVGISGGGDGREGARERGGDGKTAGSTTPIILCDVRH